MGIIISVSISNNVSRKKMSDSISVESRKEYFYRTNLILRAFFCVWYSLKRFNKIQHRNDYEILWLLLIFHFFIMENEWRSIKRLNHSLKTMKFGKERNHGSVSMFVCVCVFLSGSLIWFYFCTYTHKWNTRKINQSNIFII